MRRNVTSVGILVVTFLAVASVVTGEELLRIGSWNIQNLGERDWGQHEKALAQHVWLAGVDLLVLQEIHDTDGVGDTRTNGTLDGIVTLLNEHPGQNWEYLLLPKRDAGDTIQLTGLLWNGERVSLVGAPSRPGSPRTAAAPRPAPPAGSEQGPS